MRAWMQGAHVEPLHGSLHEPLHDEPLAVELDGAHRAVPCRSRRVGLSCGLPLSARPAARAFLLRTQLYVLSRQWKGAWRDPLCTVPPVGRSPLGLTRRLYACADLLVVHILRMQPLPYCVSLAANCTGTSEGCGGPHEAMMPCTPPAPFADQALLAVLLLIASPLVVHHVRENRESQMPSMVGMCVGWVLGDALVQLHVEVIDSIIVTGGGGASEEGVRALCNVLAATASTLASAMLLVTLERSAQRLRLRAALKLPSEAIMTAVMVAWAHTFKDVILAGLALEGHAAASASSGGGGSGGGSPVHAGSVGSLGVGSSAAPSSHWSSAGHSGLVERVLLLWAVCLSTAFALLVTKLVSCRQRIALTSCDGADAGGSGGGAHRSGGNGYGDLCNGGVGGTAACATACRVSASGFVNGGGGSAQAWLHPPPPSSPTKGNGSADLSGGTHSPSHACRLAAGYRPTHNQRRSNSST